MGKKKVKIEEICCEKQAVIAMKKDVSSDLDKVADLADILSLGYHIIKQSLSSAIYSEHMTKDEADESIEHISKLLKTNNEEIELLRGNDKHNRSKS